MQTRTETITADLRDTLSQTLDEWLTDEYGFVSMRVEYIPNEALPFVRAAFAHGAEMAARYARLALEKDDGLDGISLLRELECQLNDESQKVR